MNWLSIFHSSLLMTIDQYISSQLNEEQMQATTYTDSSSLIVAGAGSGKTRVLTYKIAYLIYHHNISPTNILAVTFTNRQPMRWKKDWSKSAKNSVSLYQTPLFPLYSHISSNE
jgi:superfamily I DNA and RNA helicase